MLAPPSKETNWRFCSKETQLQLYGLCSWDIAQTVRTVQLRHCTDISVCAVGTLHRQLGLCSWDIAQTVRTVRLRHCTDISDCARQEVTGRPPSCLHLVKTTWEEVTWCKSWCLEIGKWCERLIYSVSLNDPEGEWMYSSTLSSTLALDGVGGQRHAPAALGLRGLF
jgi:hypothetical protein